MENCRSDNFSSTSSISAVSSEIFLSNSEDSDSGINTSESFNHKVKEVLQNQNSDPKMFLRNWSFKHNITHTALSDLLSWFAINPDLSSLPTNARTLLKTPSHVDVEKQGSGDFFYFGVKQNLVKIAEKFVELDTFHLNFGIDGLPLHKSTNTSFWSILCKVNNFSELMFPVASYCGNNKPPLNDFFSKFVYELS